MKIDRCICGQPLFFENSQCLRCGAVVGFCPVCRNVSPLQAVGDGTYCCGHLGCGAHLMMCANYSEYQVCNRCVEVPADGSLPPRYCDCCRYNQTIPDLTVAGNWQKWYRLEAAKRRLFYDLDLLSLPHGTRADGFQPPLSFDFKADVIPVYDLWRTMGDGERVYTGHANGHITINIREADEVERERLRVDMGEAHRTLIGHFRHEIGHYYYDLLIRGKREGDFAAVFGDPYQQDYAAGMESYYQSGAPWDWSERFISSYASMHSWEDWAESFAMYLDMVSSLETAVNLGFVEPPWFEADNLDGMVSRYQQLGIGLNEMSRTMGLLDMVPEIMVRPVIEKIRFIHAVCLKSAS
jgi:hypothetical protein